MNIKVSTKYQINDYLKGIRIYYLIIILSIAFFAITSTYFNSNFMGTGGIEFATTIFLFVVGLNSFKEQFLMMLQNGISRKNMFLGRIATLVAASIFMAIVDRLIINISGLLFNSDNFYMTGFYDVSFEKRVAALNSFTINLEAILISIGIYLSALALGYFITTAYYRMNKVLKTIVSISLPVLVLVLLPMLDTTIFNNTIGKKIYDFTIFIAGGSSGTPYNLLLTCFLFTLACIGLSWLLIRRAVEKI